ncbi:MAG: four helix bundle protein [Anaerolineae bacterium]|nr:four helix bundle protein [Anaerolineae bacterium]
MIENLSGLRRSSKSIIANFVEGYGRRYYPKEYIKFLTYALASCDETKAHLELLYETGSMSQDQFNTFYPNYRKIGT